MLVSIFDLVPLPFDAAWISVILCGIPIILEAVIGLVTAFDIKADVLVSIALIASLCIGENFAAGEVAFIMQLGALLEDLTVAKARAGIEKLVRLTPQTARVIKNGKEERVRVGDILRVLPGETIPVDGVICSGQTSINQAVMTGESMPVDKKEGDEVSSGTVNQFGAFDMEAVKVGEDSSIQRMIKLVQSANAGKAKIVRLADRWATWIVVIALSAALITGLITGEIIRAVTILVVFDTLRKESMETIEKIKQFGAEPVLLTGDNENAAQHMARKLRIGEVYAGCLPEDKLQYIDGCRKNGKSVCMIGDGVNDAPALKMADVGIAMGGIGSDIAVDAADIALVDDKVGKLPHLLSFSKRMMTTIKWNLTFSMILNFAAITLAITGILSPVVGALVHNAGSVLVIINSAFLLKWRKKR